MMKHIRTLAAAAAAALAASAALVSVSAPAIAQELAGAPQETPRLFEEQNRDWDRDRDDYDRDRDYDRRRAPDFQYAQEQCSRAGIQEAWRRNYYSAQYEGRPRLEYGRYGWELRGRMRLHDRRGYNSVNTLCDLRNGRSNASSSSSAKAHNPNQQEQPPTQRLFTYSATAMSTASNTTPAPHTSLVAPASALPTRWTDPVTLILCPLKSGVGTPASDSASPDRQTAPPTFPRSPSTG